MKKSYIAPSITIEDMYVPCNSLNVNSGFGPGEGEAKSSDFNDFDDEEDVDDGFFYTK